MEDKRDQILQSAVKTICQYGYRRTSMEDIAKEAGVSRPAIYQHFKNKEAVAHAALEMVVAQALVEAAQAAALKEDPNQKLTAYLVAYMTFYYRLLFSGPHVSELMEVKQQFGSEKPSAARAQVIEILNGIMDLKPDSETGAILVSSAEGIKMAAPDEEVLARRIKELTKRFLGK
jgi:AcrR family transcriptional regulator